MEQIELIKKLQDPSIYHPPCKNCTVIETHISWVILTGYHAYKIKKGIDLEFLDYTSLEKRKHFCEEELRLNREFVPELYLEVVKITQEKDRLKINGDGEIIEYAVKMQEFPQENLFDHLLQHGKLKEKHIIWLAERLARLHQKTRKVPLEKEYGSPKQVHEPIKQNFTQIREFISEANDIDQLNRLASWADEQLENLHSVFEERKAMGFIRECHGDTHLGNILLLQNKAMIFDCIEFNESFRCTDVMADLGFLAMDFEEKGKPQFSNILISTYCIETGDYHGLQVIAYYKAYRAMVRAKVNTFGLAAKDLTPEAKQTILKEYHRRTGLAESYIKLAKPRLYITHGLSASGKSRSAQEIMTAKPVLHIRSDIERKRLHHLSATAKTQSDVLKGLYTPEITEKTYEQLLKIAGYCLQSGFSIVIDGSFIKEKFRSQFQQLANSLEIPFYILSLEAPIEILKQRITQRLHDKNEPSEAYIEVLEMQVDAAEALTQDELKNTIIFDSIKPFDLSALEPQS